MNTKKPTEPVIVKEKMNALIGPIESRASRMLKAALSQKVPLREHVASSDNDQIVFKRVQQIEEQQTRRRSNKSNVAFTDPVVSVEHEYEPTYLDETDQDRSCKRSTRDQPTPAKFRMKPASPVKKPVESKKTSYTKDNTKKGYGGQIDDDDDDDDELFILARSDDIVAKEEKLIDRVAKSAPKRNYEAMQESEDENHGTDKQQAGKEESNSGGLFSSPKVAKIAPYFDDRPHDRRAAEAKVIQQNRVKSQYNNYQRSRSSANNRSYLQRSSGEMTITETARRPPSMNSQTHNRVTELLSYKKVSSPKLGDQNVMHATEATKLQSDPYCKTEQQMPGYFNWFTSFITSQMNKLIF